MDKIFLVGQLEAQLRGLAQGANEASAAAAEEARSGATAKERRSDTRLAIEYSSLALGQSQRARRAFAELATLEAFRPSSFVRGAQVDVGAIVEIEDDEGEGRTFFLAPVGAGITLTGPGGDGFLSVVTPSSPIGRAVLGRRVGDVVDVTVAGDVREWTITWIE